MITQRAQDGYRLSWLLDGIAEVPAQSDCSVTGIALDSRKVRGGDLFLAYRGERTHGARYIGAAVEAGAHAVVLDSGSGYADAGSHPGITLVEVDDLRAHAGEIASRFFGEPSRAMAVIGVTGTNGKTTVTHLVAQALDRHDARCGLAGTLGYGFPGRLERAERTTPDPVSVQRLLSALRGQGAAAVAMEVSSHALEQFRIAGVHFTVAAFTNLTRDHLDYHENIEAYGRAKQRLFETADLEHAVINTDDAFGREILRALPPRVTATATGTAPGTRPTPADCASRFVEVTNLELSAEGVGLHCRTHAGEIEIASRLVGEFNAHNLALAAGILLALGLDTAEIGERLSEAETVPGRMEAFGGDEGAPLVIVDYAHTPDALEMVLRAARAHCRGALWCVFGCGGERDQGKRPQMGAVAAAWADHVVMTDDNPRGEDPARIIADIVAGLPATAGYEIEHDRALAIAGVLERANADDVVVVAGKGHEDYQVIGAEIRPFSDRDTVTEILRGGWA